jgi:predicted dehydrogenase
MGQEMTDRRGFLKTAGGAALTTSLFTGNVKGANDRITCAVIGVGRMGTENLRFAIGAPGVEVVKVCDIYQPHLEEAVAIAAKAGAKVQTEADFRKILDDKSIDTVNISTPDHWHAYMTVEACKRGKDDFVEKPLCTHLYEGLKMVEAARKYNRVVQAGTMQRSGVHFQKAAEIVKSGALGKLRICRTWFNAPEAFEPLGKPADCDPPAGLDWDMWLGPAPKRPFNPNRWGVHPELKPRRPFPYFRFFWDYAGGMMTDWGVHLLDILHFATNDPMPVSIAAVGGNFLMDDNRDTPDSLAVAYQYPQGVLASFESMTGADGQPHPGGPGTWFCGTKGNLYVNRQFYEVNPLRPMPARAGVAPPPPDPDAPKAETVKASNNMNAAHWANFIECVKSRQKPISDVETCFKTTAACQLANASFRSGVRLDWDDQLKTVKQKEARKFLEYNYRAPWKLEV